MKKLLPTLALSLMFVVGCTSNDSAPATQGVQTAQETQVEQAETVESEPEPPAAGAITFGDTFEFDDLEITFYDAIEWVTVENQFSDHHGADVARVPMSITNMRDDTHGLNMFLFDIFGSNGTRLDNMSAWFTSDDVSFAGDMRSGATQNTYMHILYDGDGDYYVEFSQIFGPTTEVRLPIAR